MAPLPMNPMILITAAERHPTVDNTLGAVLIGTLISLVLYGIFVHQVYRYYSTYPHDTLFLKAYVAIILFLETFCSVLSAHVCYDYAVTNFLNPSGLLHISWSSSALSIVGAVVFVLVQSFYVHRVWHLKPQFRWLVVIAVLLVLLELAVCFIAGIESSILQTWPTFAQFWAWLPPVHNMSTAVSDLLITGLLISTLQTRRTSIKQTDSMINLLILYSISTGLLTGVYNLLSFLFSVIFSHSLIYMATVIVGIKLYSNSLLAALNSRRYIRDRHGGDVALLDNEPFGVSPQPRNVQSPRDVSNVVFATIKSESGLPTSSSQHAATTRSQDSAEMYVSAELFRSVDDANEEYSVDHHTGQDPSEKC